MIEPNRPKNELARLKAIKSYKILDTLPETDYDDITALIAATCNVPIALITILDKERNYLKSHHGIDFNESPRNTSFCGHTILSNEILIVKDSRKDERFINNPLVTEQAAIFYAGVPLINPEGYALGTLCIYDHEPRDLTELQIKSLRTLGRQVVNILELRRKNFYLNQTKKELLLRNERLNTFAAHVSHDLKSPLANIISLTDLLRDDKENNLTEESKGYLNYIEESAHTLNNYIEGILSYYKADELLKAKKETIQLSDVASSIKKVLFTNTDQLVFNDSQIEDINTTALSQILINLIDNSLKYNDKDHRVVEIEYESIPDYHKFSVTDNGIGIPESQQEHIFEIFKTTENSMNISGTGIGLSTVKSLVEKLNGEISVSSKENEGSTFTFKIAK